MSSHSIGLFFAILFVSRVVSACEGECIIGITNVFLGNYSAPVAQVLLNISGQINDFLPTSSRLQDPTYLVDPIVDAYKNMSFNSLETAIFPSYFHGKCQRFSNDGQDPPGCPDPDCPVVCGTPGSLVHFYSTLRYIAYNDTRSLLETIVNPNGETFQKVADLIEEAQESSNNRMLKRWTRSDVTRHGPLYLGRDYTSFYARRHQFPHYERYIKRDVYNHARRTTSSIASDLKNVLDQMGSLLLQVCGGSPTNSSGGLPDCSWETNMKSYILTFT